MANGSVTKKGSHYRKSLINAVKNDSNHPINQGIHMEAHHIVSAESVKLAKIGRLLVEKGYNINLIGNLVFLPATLPGACHLEVQLHRGNHYSYAEEQDNDDDDAHSIDYHFKISRLLLGVEDKLKACDSHCETSARKAQALVDRVSKQALKKIAKFQVPLSPVHKSFKSGIAIGCGNCVDVNEHLAESSACNSGRMHEGEEHAKFRNGNFKKTITRKNSDKKYELRVGR